MSESAAGLAASRALRRAYEAYLAYRVKQSLFALWDAVERKRRYDPNQPRVPASNPDGGQWTDGDGSSGRSRRPSLFARLSPGSDLDSDLLFDDSEQLARVAQNQGRGQGQGQGSGRARDAARHYTGVVTLRNGTQVPATPQQESTIFGLRVEASRLERQIRNFDPNWRPTPSLVQTIQGEIAATRAEVQQAQNYLTGLRERAVGPGPYAKESIPARGPSRNFTETERREINRIGRKDGCHTCGTRDPGTPSGNFIPDHQQPNALTRPGESQRLFPQCWACSRQQGGHVGVIKKTRGREK
ncbi:MAG: hypothetical protein QNJ62_12930 [Methyloceanibacter sp.]|nr:hypothetical protein [Methyloceanibacter sp.]